MISGVATRYDLCDDDPLVGRLVADRELAIQGEVTHLYSLMHDGRWLLVNGDTDIIDRGGEWTARVRVVTADAGPSMLIRPDGCIAWAGRSGGLRAAVEHWFRT
jgi:hypothetical protein